MQYNQFSGLGEVLLNKGNAWTVPAMASGGTAAAMPSYSLFAIGGSVITTVHIGLGFTVFVGILSAINITMAIYERSLNIRLKLDELEDRDETKTTNQP